MTEDQAIYEKTLIKFGTDRQIDKLIEEMAELTTALMHFKYGRENNVAEEFADVTIVMKQLKEFFNNDNAINNWVGIKIDRLSKKVL